MSRQIVYLRGRGEEMRELIAAFAARSYRVLLLRRMDEVLPFVAKSLPAAVIVDASAGDAEISERIIELQNAKPLFELPVVFIGRRVEERSAVALQKYKKLFVLDLPFDVAGFIGRFVAGLEGKEPGLRAELDSDPGRLQGTYGGALLASAQSLDAFRDEALLPPHPRREELKRALADISRRDPWLGVQARRSAFVAAAMGTSLGFAKEEDALIRTAGLLLNWAFSQDAGANSRYDLLQLGDAAERSSIANLFRGSGALVAEELEDAGAALTIKSVADLLGSDGRVAPARRKEAEMVLVSEVSTRACWATNLWNPLGAYRALRFLRSSPMLGDNQIRQSMGRILGEALLMEGKGGQAVLIESLDAEEREQRKKKAEQAAAEAQQYFTGADAKKVRLFELEPGMLLVEPLLSGEGQLVLPSRTVLDFDLIARVLQLAAVRSVKDPVLVRR
jgi:hypothetical protein